MAHAALVKGQKKYGTVNYIIRAKLFKGLKDSTMNVGSIFDDEKIKIKSGPICSYCGATDELSLDHIIPKKLGGKDEGDNLIYACKSCNSSKGGKDLMEWMDTREKLLPLLVIRRYLKLVLRYSRDEDLLDLNLDDPKINSLPFSLEHIPKKFPSPEKLLLNY